MSTKGGDRIVALAWGAATLAFAFWAISIALGPKADASGWLMAAAFAVVALICAWRTWREWTSSTRQAQARSNQMSVQPPLADPAVYPGAWRGPDIPLETQIDALKEAGLAMEPGRTINELLTSWPRADYEADPYNLLLFMYGSEVEAEPEGRWFCTRGWNFDHECLVEAGDYVRAFTQVLRITGQAHIVAQMSDDFDINSEIAEINYTMNGQLRRLKARINSDWADPEAVAAFMRDIETAIADGRHYWAADNGQSAVLFFLTDAEAAKINALRKDVLTRYIT